MAFCPTGPGLDIFKKRYAISPEESWEQACRRVAKQVAMAESGELINKWEKRFESVLLDNLFMPAGRIWYGSGRPKAALVNCFVISSEDSREGWARTVSDMIIISSMGGGVGINFSPIRPYGSPIRSSGGIATGPVSLMQIINSAGDVIKAGGGRRTALMMALSLDHPDIMEFLNKKLDLNQLNNANISVIIPWGKSEQFIDAVKNDKPWELIWQGKTIKEVSARKLYDTLINNMLKSAEPGILNLDLANEMSNVSYCRELVASNPCGEILLSINELCCLGSLVLPRFIINGEFNWDLLAETITVAVRFLDNVLDVTTYPNSDIANNVAQLRRIGLGIMGLHDALIMSNLRYDSTDALSWTSKLLKFIRNRAYEASAALAIEKGKFPAHEQESFMKSKFIKTLSKGTKSMVKEHGVRNCALLSIPPTGTTSIVCGCSSGIEPIFAKAYKRRFYENETLKEEIWTHPLYEKYLTEGLDTCYFQSAHEIGFEDHLKMQATCQAFIDNAVSKTINISLKDSTNVEIGLISEKILEYLPQIKGLTIYVDGTRGSAPFETVDESEVLKNLCPKGVCEI